MDPTTTPVPPYLSPSNYSWIYYTGFIFAFAMAFGIGANDVANAFGPSVGAKTLKLWQAVIIAAIFEFSGSLLMGGAVVDTISKIADPNMFIDEPATLMLGMLTTLIGAGSWVLLATKLELPVSTTHSVIGAIMGFALCAKGVDAIKWDEMVGIIISWFLSPVLAGLAGAGLFWTVRRFILRSENSLQRGLYFYPALISITLAVNIFFIMYKGPFHDEIEESLEVWAGILVSIGCGVVIAAILQFVAVPALKRKLAVMPASSVLPSNASGKVQVEDDDVNETSGLLAPGESKSKDSGMFSRFLSNTVARDIHAEEKSEEVSNIHSSAEVFDERTEDLFSYLQVATACFASFAHGANDVANSVAPFATIYYIYANGVVPTDEVGVEVWILAYGGAGIVAGLALYGYKVMRTLGTKLIKMTPSRGFAIELAAATVVVTASMIGLPISSTHCQVGASVAIGACEGQSGFNRMLFFKTFGAWIFTIVFAGFVAAGIFSFAFFSPFPNPAI